MGADCRGGTRLRFVGIGKISGFPFDRPARAAEAATPGGNLAFGGRSNTDPPEKSMAPLVPGLVLTLRRARGLSQAEAAETFKFELQTWWWETEERHPVAAVKRINGEG